MIMGEASKLEALSQYWIIVDNRLWRMPNIKQQHQAYLEGRDVSGFSSVKWQINLLQKVAFMLL